MRLPAYNQLYDLRRQRIIVHKRRRRSSTPRMVIILASSSNYIGVGGHIRKDKRCSDITGKDTIVMREDQRASKQY